MTRIKDITNQQFGSLTAVSLSHKGANSLAYWNYRCKCGKTHVARANTVAYVAKKALLNNDIEIPSCGCVELSRKTRHGFRKAKDTHPAYRMYKGMMDRCYNPNVSSYKWYGAKGVTVCDEWRNNPAAFVRWAIETGYQPGLHIDKDIKSDALGLDNKEYSPATCQWVTAKENVGYATDRRNYGRHPNVKLSDEQVAEILRLYNEEGLTGTHIAKLYELNSASVYRLIKLNRTESNDSV